MLAARVIANRKYRKREKSGPDGRESVQIGCPAQVAWAGVLMFIRHRRIESVELGFGNAKAGQPARKCSDCKC